MNGAHVARSLLDAEHAAFILQPGISITTAACVAGRAPQLGRALGCRVNADRARIHVLLPADQHPELVDAVRDTCAIAAVFSQPSTHRTIQLKGRDAVVTPADAADHALAERWIEGFVAELDALGYAESLVRAFLWCEPAAMVAVGFTPSAAFQQTPGPQAGAPLAA